MSLSRSRAWPTTKTSLVSVLPSPISCKCMCLSPFFLEPSSSSFSHSHWQAARVPPSLSSHVPREKNAIDGCQRVAHSTQHAHKGECQCTPERAARALFHTTMQALLHATDAQGMMVWDENHRNGQDSEGHVSGIVDGRQLVPL